MRLGEADAASELERAPGHLERAAARPDRLEEAHLDLDRGVADTGRQERLDRAAGRGVEDRAEPPAVDGSDRVVDRLVGLAPEDRRPVAGRDEVEPEQLRDRRRRQAPLDDRREEVPVRTARRRCPPEARGRASGSPSSAPRPTGPSGVVTRRPPARTPSDAGSRPQRYVTARRQTYGHPHPHTPVGRSVLGGRVGDPACVTHTRIVNLAHGRQLLIRPLRNGDVETVLDVFERLGERSRRARFNGAKPRLRDDELAHLARRRRDAPRARRLPPGRPEACRARAHRP